MKLFKHSSGTIFSFGFDMISRKPDPYKICWCDPKTYDWEPTSTNGAGWIEHQFGIFPEFIREIGSRIVLYQTGRMMIELVYVGAPTMWTTVVLTEKD